MSAYYFHDIHRERIKEKTFDIESFWSYSKTIQTIDPMSTDHRCPSITAWIIFIEFIMS